MSTQEKLAKIKDQAISQLNDCGVSTIDNDRLETIVNRFRTVVDNKDAMLVSGTDESELATVQRNFIAKHLKIDDKDKGMAAIEKTALQMKAIKFKNRAAFYYLVQDNLK